MISQLTPSAALATALLLVAVSCGDNAAVGQFSFAEQSQKVPIQSTTSSAPSSISPRITAVLPTASLPSTSSPAQQLADSIPSTTSTDYVDHDEEAEALNDGALDNGRYLDPRGPLFENFQESFDREERFSRLDVFCRPPAAVSGEGAAPVESAVAESSIVIAQIETRLDELAKVGFAVPIGEPGAMVQTFVDIVNDTCDGIHGRSLDLRTISVSALGGGTFDIDTLREAACLEAVEVHEAVAVLAITPIPGTAASCLTRRNRVSHLAVRGISDLDLSNGGGLLHSIEVGDRSGLGLAVQTALDLGLLDGATIGVVVPDSPQRSDDLVGAIINPLTGLDMTVASYQLGCDGTTTCRVGLDNAVAAMVADGVDVVVPLLDMTSLPWLILEMLSQGMPRPLFVQSGLDGQGLDAVASRVAEFGGPPAGAYYNGAVVVDGSATGVQRIDGAERRPFDQVCVEAWAKATSKPLPTPEDASDDVHRTVVEACSLVRWIARAAESAGPNPSRLAIQVAIAAVGPLDVPDMRPTTIDGRRWRTVQVRRYEYPCQHGVGFGVSGGCLVPDGKSIVVDRASVPVSPDGPFSRPPHEVTVFVANGSNIGGLAGKVSKILDVDGYETTRPGNAFRTATSTIFHRTGFLGDALAVGTTLGLPGNVVAVPDEVDFAPEASVERSLTSDVIVVIGSADAIRFANAD
ncbi:MAG: LytR C-terminal domain-containing protein [Acidimicrobiales bacterium]|nr:LytR C-terminal domain-containing protein [Acidimicrobiales bacterium]